MRQIKRLPVLLFLVLPLTQLYSQKDSRKIVSFNSDWKFHLGESSKAYDPAFDDGDWRIIQLPQDWSIEGKFNEHNPAGTSGGALPGGVGWYRKSFTLPQSSKGKNVFIDFDGVYRKSQVWINGHLLGLRLNGYISFQYDLTPYLKFGNEKNIISVRVDNSQQPNSRWYSGSGIYRNVWLNTTGKTFVDHWGTFITTSDITADSANIHIGLKINNTGSAARTVTVKSMITDMRGLLVATVSSDLRLSANSVTETQQETKLPIPHLWSVTDPYLYQVITEVDSEQVPIDHYATRMGIRYFEFDVVKGFLLNGKKLKINGVCNHHDLGCLGSAVNKRAIARQLEILKAMGCNAIRTSHNPPAPELLDLCDQMGFIVMDEAFDMWKEEKTTYDYHLDWDSWHKKDLEDQILRDRNHPSVFIWSIGNEIPEQWAKDSSGYRMARELGGIIRSLDTTRPITSALNDHDLDSNAILRSGTLDLVGYNYAHEDYPDFPKRMPGKKFIGTETVSALETRGYYEMPSDSIHRWPSAWDKPFTTGNPEFTCSSYDNVSTPWGSTHEETWKIIKKHDYLSGQFIWTGFDYIGEPTPYPWPARSSYFGIIDLAGFPKDSYYMYQSEWTDQPVLHIFPHWNWKEGDSVDVWAYFNQADEVELFLNGKSLGAKRKSGDDLHVMWRVLYEPGTIKAVSLKNGRMVLSSKIKTAGKAYRIVLKADRLNFNADGQDLSFVTAKIVDAAGNLVPHADNLIRFKILGEGSIIATDNGSPISLESFQSTSHKAFNGLCLAVVQSKKKSGSIQITAISDGLFPGSIALTAKN